MDVYQAALSLKDNLRHTHPAVWDVRVDGLKLVVMMNQRHVDKSFSIKEPKVLSWEGFDITLRYTYRPGTAPKRVKSRQFLVDEE